MTGSVNAPQVHFELRRGAKPVNRSTTLPAPDASQT